MLGRLHLRFSCSGSRMLFPNTRLPTTSKLCPSQLRVDALPFEIEPLPDTAGYLVCWGILNVDQSLDFLLCCGTNGGFPLEGSATTSILGKDTIRSNMTFTTSTALVFSDSEMSVQPWRGLSVSAIIAPCWKSSAVWYRSRVRN